MKVFLGIDWGGSYIKAGLVDSGGRIIKKRIFTSRDLSRKGVFLKNIKGLYRQFAGFKIKALGVGAPGIVDVKRGFIYYLPNIPGWKNYPLKQVLTRSLRLPVFVDNDANLFALAESRRGAGQGVSRAIYLTLGTGLGGAVILDGRILEGKTSAGELAHFPVSLKGRACGCGGRGCIETLVGNKYLERRYAALKKGSARLPVKEIFARARAGERQALRVWDEFAYNLGMYLAGLVNVFGPQRIVLGGGVAGAISIFKPRLLSVIKQQAMWPQLKGVKIVKAKLKDAGLIGAGLLAKERSKL